MTASSISLPATRTEREYTMPLMEMTAMSVVPPPMSTTMFPEGSSIGRPAPMGAATACSTTSNSPARGGGGPDDARVHEHAPVMRLLDEVGEHFFGHLEIGDDAVLHRLDGHHIARRAAEHFLGVLAD